MIKHHPTFELLKSFVGAELPASLSAAVAMHADMCPDCQNKIAQLTEQYAEASFEIDNVINNGGLFDEGKLSLSESELNFDDMISDITSNESIAAIAIKEKKSISFNNKTYEMPTALHSMSVGKTANIGKLCRARIQLNEGEIHTSLLHIEPGGGVPEHTHKGFELTLLLDGSFSDEQGSYEKGDFIMLDGRHKHHPVSEQGCLCYTVANDALHFTQGINKLLNPIGSFIY